MIKRIPTNWQRVSLCVKEWGGKIITIAAARNDDGLTSTHHRADPTNHTRRCAVSQRAKLDSEAPQHNCVLLFFHFTSHSSSFFFDSLTFLFILWTAKCIVVFFCHSQCDYSEKKSGKISKIHIFYASHDYNYFAQNTYNLTRRYKVAASQAHSPIFFNCTETQKAQIFGYEKSFLSQEQDCCGTFGNI